MVYAAVAGTALVVAAAVAIGWRRRGRSDHPHRHGGHLPSGTNQLAPGRVLPAQVRVLCLSCQGRGWIDRRERTLTFTGEGFADVEHPPTMCEPCKGSGRVTR